MKKAIVFVSLAISILGNLGCSRDDDGKPKSKKPGSVDSQPASLQELFGSKFSQSTFKIVDERGQAIKAEILIGTALNEPFSGNLIQTDENGEALLPEAWTTALPVTVHANGFVDVTYLEQSPQALHFTLRRAPNFEKRQLRGTTTGYSLRDNDDFVDFGMVIKGLTKNEILGFDITKVMSLDMDKMSVVGKEIQVPSNLSLPRQKESYIIPITLDKAQYRMNFSSFGTHKVMGVRGRFPFRAVIKEVQNDKDLVELINYFSLEGGAVKDVQINSADQVLNMNLSEIRFTETVPVKAPRVRTDEIVLALLAQDINGVLMPTDVKKLESDEARNLKTSQASSAYVLRVLKRESEFDPYMGAANADRLSAIWQKSTATRSDDFLKLIDNPRVQGRDILLEPPQVINGITPYATYLVLSELKEIDYGKGKTKIPLSRWEIYVPGWVNHVSLPQRVPSTEGSPQWRWEASFLGGAEASSDVGPDMISKTTHVTRSSVDF